MAKYQLVIESVSLEGLLKELEKQFQLFKEQKELIAKTEKAMKTRVPCRNNKAWTDWDLQFLVENYRKKKIKWIAEALNRKPHNVYAKLNQLYKTKNLPRANNVSK